MPAASSIILGGSALLSAGSSVIAGNKAAKAAEKGSELSAETERYFYDTTRADQAPYRDVGKGALYKLADMMGVGRPVDTQGQTQAAQQPFSLSGDFGGFDFSGLGGNFGAPQQAQPQQMTPGYEGFQASPGYQFRLSEGVKAAERSAAARGQLASGGTLKAIQRYGEGLASSEYDNYSNRLAALAGVGQTSTQATSQAGQAAAGGISAAFTNAGNARASAYGNTGASINNGITNLASSYLYGQNGGWGTPGIGGNDNRFFGSYPASRSSAPW